MSLYYDGDINEAGVGREVKEGFGETRESREAEPDERRDGGAHGGARREREAARERVSDTWLQSKRATCKCKREGEIQERERTRECCVDRACPYVIKLIFINSLKLRLISWARKALYI